MLSFLVLLTVLRLTDLEVSLKLNGSFSRKGGTKITAEKHIFVAMFLNGKSLAFLNGGSLSFILHIQGASELNVFFSYRCI